MLFASERALHFVSTAEPLTAAPQLTPLPVVFAEGGSGELLIGVASLMHSY